MLPADSHKRENQTVLGSKPNLHFWDRRKKMIGVGNMGILILILLLFFLCLKVPTYYAREEDHTSSFSSHRTVIDVKDGPESVVWVVQLSDLHFSVHHPDRAIDFKNIVPSALSMINPSLVLITGDLTGLNLWFFSSSFLVTLIILAWCVFGDFHVWAFLLWEIMILHFGFVWKIFLFLVNFGGEMEGNDIYVILKKFGLQLNFYGFSC